MSCAFFLKNQDEQQENIFINLITDAVNLVEKVVALIKSCWKKKNT